MIYYKQGDTMLIKILVLVVLILFNGIFSATEIAFLSINKYKLNKVNKIDTIDETIIEFTWGDNNE